MSEKIEAYLYQLTMKIHDEPTTAFSAPEIAQQLQLSRSTVSSSLNRAFRQKRVVKIKAYPVLFLHKEALQQQKILVEHDEYASLEELFVPEKTSALESVIGASGSLKEAIDQIKTAVLYPNHGLPLLLAGASGSGKTFLAEKIHEYSIEQRVIDPAAPFIAYNCAQYYNNPELLSSALFGYTKGAFTGADKEQSGLIEKAAGGILFLDEVHRLSEEGQEKLFTFMDTGYFSPMGDTSIRKQVAVRLIFATTENVYSAFLPTFLRRLPVIINLPKFQHRPQLERLMLIDTFFIGESNILSKEIHVSYQMIDFLLNSDLEGNVGKIKNIIKYACGSAYVRYQTANTIHVHLRDLPLEYNIKYKELISRPKKKIADRHYLPHTNSQPQLENKESQSLRKFFNELLVAYKELQKNNQPQVFIEAMVQKVTNRMDEFIFQTSYEKEASFYSVLTYHIRQTLSFMHESYGFEQEGNRVVALANYLYLKNNNELLSGNDDWLEARDSLLEFLNTSLGTSYWYAKKLLGHLSQQLDQTVFEEDLVFIALYFNSLNIAELSSGIRSIVLAHGYSTASSLANVVNRMLGKNVFQAYDMPINITLEKVEEQITRYLNDYRPESGLILMVDMGSLNQLGKRLLSQIKGPLLIIDNVSTPILLEIGEQILKGKSIHDIHQMTEVNQRIKKQLILPKVNKKKAILTCCYTGMGSAKQIQDILTKCLGDIVKELTILPYDYKKLTANKLYETPFQLYDVLMIVGTENPKIEQIPYIGLEQLINGEAVAEFVRLISRHFVIKDEKFKETLLFNFSINKIVENLTILDATKVLSLVQQAMKEIESSLQLSFSNNQLFILYLHTCCMIERILRKESVDEQTDIEAYLQREQQTLEVIHQAFKQIEREYTIVIPDLELRLLNDIIQE
ncbi:sigma 54-interacting transcriptional regulator [Enterococcus faecalis]